MGLAGVNAWFIPVSTRTPNWKLTPGTTWQVRRSYFDGMMLEEAEVRGANVVRGGGKACSSAKMAVCVP